MPLKKSTAVTKRVVGKNKGASLNFSSLVGSIQQVHEQSAAVVNCVVNATLTLRNWFIGHYIVEYELKGVDRAKYGERLISMLAEELARLQISRCDRRELFRYQRFYRTYPQIVGTASPQWMERLKGAWTVRPLTPYSNAEAGFPIVETLSPQSRFQGKSSWTAYPSAISPN